MINSFLLNYTRFFPLEYGKKIIVPFIRMPVQIEEYTNKYGAKFLLDTREYQMKQIYLYDLYERNTIRNLVGLVKPGYTFFDIGSNIGFYALTFAKILFNGKVYCFEPNHISFERLKHNLAISNIGNVILNEVGLSDEKKDVESNYNLLNMGTASIYTKRSFNPFSQIIHLMTLDDYCDQHDIYRIDFIKVDIEGGEYPFLKGAEYIIKQSKKLILVMEMMEENFIEAGYTSKQIFEYVLGLGFKAYLPKSFPFRMREVYDIFSAYSDNIIFLRGY